MGNREVEEEEDKNRGGNEFLFGDEEFFEGDGDSLVEKNMILYFIFVRINRFFIS